MDRSTTRRTAVVAALGVFGVITVVSVAPALAAFPDDSVKTYTGCLVNGGNVNYLKEGDSPAQPCSSPKNVVKLSGGDITRVTVTGALTGGGVNGAVTIGLDPAKTVPSGCTNGQVPKWSTSAIPAAWACGNDNDTTYSAGTGLDLTGTTFSVDPDAFLAGTGLDKTGTTFSVKPDAFTKKDQACATGTFVTGADGSGVMTCGTPSNGLPVFHTARAQKFFDNDEGRTTKVMTTLALPAGTWAIGTQVRAEGYDSAYQGFLCTVAGLTPLEGKLAAEGATRDSLTYEYSFSNAKITLNADTTLNVECNAYSQDVLVSVTATQVQ